MKFSFFRKKKGSELDKIIGDEGTRIEEDERAMIRGIVELGETAVKEIMVPRTDVVAADVGMTFEEVVQLFVKSGHSRIPVYERTIDNTIGFLYAKDLLTALRKKPNSFDVRKLIRMALFIPEGKMVDELLKDFRQKKVHIAVVVDEYGGMAGIVSLEDVLEEIVGEIQDEYDEEEEDVKKVSPGTYLLDGRLPIEKINEELDLAFPADMSDTIGGFVFNLFGKIPEVLETVRYGNVEFQVEEIEGRRIKKIRMTAMKEEQ